MRSTLDAPEPLTDLLDRALGNDPIARQKLIGRYRPLLRLVANRYTGRLFRCRYDESDVVQMTCLDAFRSFDHFNGDSPAEFNRWVEVILERNVTGLFRRHTAEARDIRREFASNNLTTDLSLAWLVDHDSGPRSKVIAGEQAVALAEAIESLPEKYRQAIELRFFDGLGLRQIATQMESSVGAVAGYLRRGLDELQQHLPTDMQPHSGGSV